MGCCWEAQGHLSLYLHGRNYAICCNSRNLSPPFFSICWAKPDLPPLRWAINSQSAASPASGHFSSKPMFMLPPLELLIVAVPTELVRTMWMKLVAVRTVSPAR